MKKITLILILFSVCSFSQELWNIPRPDKSKFYNTYSDTSVAKLKEVIENNVEDDKQFRINFIFEKPAIEILTYYHPEEKEYILNMLDTLLERQKDTWINDTFYVYEIMGALGEQSAVEGMRERIKKGNIIEKYRAIGYLARLGEFDYLDILFKYFDREPRHAEYLLPIYAAREENRNSVTQFLLSRIDTSTNDEKKVLYCQVLLSSNSEIGIEKCNEIYYEVKSINRDILFRLLNYSDFDNSPKRTIYHLSNSQDDIIFSLYLPSLRGIEYGWHTKKYIHPSFINFINNYYPNIPELKRYEVSELLNEFIVFPPDSGTTTTEVFDTLKSYQKQSLDYGWINSSDYDTLNIISNSIGDHIQSNQETEAISEITEYENFLAKKKNLESINEYAYKFLNAYDKFLKASLIASN
jgi:hypothetical protein